MDMLRRILGAEFHRTDFIGVVVARIQCIDCFQQVGAFIAGLGGTAGVVPKGNGAAADAAAGIEIDIHHRAAGHIRDLDFGHPGAAAGTGPDDFRQDLVRSGGVVSGGVGGIIMAGLTRCDGCVLPGIGLKNVTG